MWRDDLPRFRPSHCRPLTVFTRPLARLIEQFERLPGIGPRTAQRLALHLLRQPEEQSRAFADALLAARQQVGQCQRCGHLSADPICDICRNPERNIGVICVVADSRDLLAHPSAPVSFPAGWIPRAGRIDFTDGWHWPLKGPDRGSNRLLQRLDPEQIEEVILALRTPSVEGDTTSLYLARLLKPSSAG